MLTCEALLEMCGVMLACEALLEMCGVMLACEALLRMRMGLAGARLLRMCGAMRTGGRPLVQMGGLLRGSVMLAGEALRRDGGAGREGLLGVMLREVGPMTGRRGGVLGVDHDRGEAVVVGLCGQVTGDVEARFLCARSGGRGGAMRAVVRRHRRCSSAEKGPAVGTAPTLARQSRAHKSSKRVDAEDEGGISRRSRRLRRASGVGWPHACLPECRSRAW